MAIYIESLNIGQFRGICDLTVKKLNHVNIIAGNNNSGKTSVLEALLLLRDPDDFTNILRIARMRDTNIFINGITVYESFLNLFPQNNKNMEIEIQIQGICNHDVVKCKVTGSQKKVIMDPQDVIKRLYRPDRYHAVKDLGPDMIEVNAFSGELFYGIADREGKVVIEMDPYTTISGREIKRDHYLDIVYLGPADHLRGNVFDRILRTAAYKDICLRVLQLFDADIMDFFILKNEEINRSIEYVKHRKLGNMPLSTYGDGIKKVLSLADGIARAAGGILLIDEIETAIHSKYYSDIFGFIVKACMEFKVQLFITTHSLEAIDGFLAMQGYDLQQQEDHISMITFKKEIIGQKTYSRTLSGRHVYFNREQFGFEVRL